MTAHGYGHWPGVRVWAVPRWHRVLGLVVLVAVTGLFTLGAWVTLHASEGVGLFGAFWLLVVGVAVPWNAVSALRAADRLELHPDGTLLLSGPARMLHTHLGRVRELTRRRWGEGWVWVLHTDDGRVTMSADMPDVGELLDILRWAGARLPDPPPRRRPSGWRRSR